jgi:hypothetical protein
VTEAVAARTELGQHMRRKELLVHGLLPVRALPAACVLLLLK